MLTFGTGMGSAIYRDGQLMPHLELGQHPAWKSKTYDRYVGADALKKLGLAKWNRRVSRVIALVRTLLNFDHLYLGGGNAVNITLELPRDVTIVSNLAGITGGVRLWEAQFDAFFVARQAAPRGVAAEVSFFCGDATLTPEPRHSGLVAVPTSARLAAHSEV